MMDSGYTTRAVRYFLDHKGVQVLSSNKEYDPVNKPGWTTMDGLKDKTPPMREDDVVFANMENDDALLELPEVMISGETVEKVAGKLLGSAGLTGFD